VECLNDREKAVVLDGCNVNGTRSSSRSIKITEVRSSDANDQDLMELENESSAASTAEFSSVAVYGYVEGLQGQGRGGASMPVAMGEVAYCESE